MVTKNVIEIPTPKGHYLNVTLITSENPTKTMVVSSATGVLQRYYHRYATYFANHNYAVFTFDYDGIGASNNSIGNLRTTNSDVVSWGANDQASVMAFAKEKYPKAPLYLITHSIGGQILGFNPNYKLADKMVLVSAQSGYWKFYKGWVNLPKMIFFWYAMIPILTKLFGYFPAKNIGLFENLPKAMALQWMRWAKNRNYMFSEFMDDDMVFNKIQCPVLGLGFPNDVFAPKEATDWLLGKLSNAKLDRRHILPKKMNIPEVKHFGYFKPKFQDSLWKMTLNWLEE